MSVPLFSLQTELTSEMMIKRSDFSSTKIEKCVYLPKQKSQKGKLKKDGLSAKEKGRSVDMVYTAVDGNKKQCARKFPRESTAQASSKDRV